MRILSIPVFSSDIKSAVDLIEAKSEESKKKNLIITATGAHGLTLSKSEKHLNSILNKSFINLPDGMPLVWIGKLKGSKGIKRCYGPDFFKNTIIATSDKTINHFLCGGKEGVAEQLKNVCTDTFGNSNIVGTYTPPFRELSDEELKNLAKEINFVNTHILWIGLSTPKQEIFAYRLSKFTNVDFICTVGAAFDFHTGRVRQAPKWIQKIGMEWFFRLLIEPKRLWKRYFTVVPLFIYYNFIEVIKGEFFKHRIEEFENE